MFLLTSSLELCRLNRSFTQNCIYPKFSEKLKFHICFLDATFFQDRALCCLAFFIFFSVQFSRCKLRNIPSKLNNVKTQLKRSDLGSYVRLVASRVLLRKEVIQPLVLERLPCYDFTPITKPTFGRVPLAVRLRTSGVPGSHGVTGGVYKARERIHRGMLIHDY